MEWSLMFVLNSVLLGAGLAMDAFSVSMANGLNEPGMKRGKRGAITRISGGVVLILIGLEIFITGIL